MTLGLPADAVPRSASDWLTRGFTSVALVCLLAAFLLVEAQLIATSAWSLWPALLTVVPMAALAFRFNNDSSPTLALGYLVVGTICIFGYSVVVLENFTVHSPSNLFSITLLKAALILTIAPSRTLAGALAWMTTGFVVGESAARVAALVVGNPIKVDIAAVALFLGVLGLRLMSGVANDRNVRAQQRLDQAAQDEELLAVRESIELRASALLHDTVLNHLAVVSSLSPGPLPAQIRGGIERDLDMLMHEKWWDASASDARAGTSADWNLIAIEASIEIVRDMGLVVGVSGDTSVLERLTEERSAALSLAMHQCLVNVVTHAETSGAEIVITGSQRDVSVMVVDGGKGFDTENTRPDRLGLRQSVRHRVEAAGGSVQVWSTPGRGTSVVIRLPAESNAS